MKNIYYTGTILDIIYARIIISKENVSEINSNKNLLCTKLCFLFSADVSAALASSPNTFTYPSLTWKEAGLLVLPWNCSSMEPDMV